MPTSLSRVFALALSITFNSVAVAGPFLRNTSVSTFAEPEEEAWYNLAAPPAAPVEAPTTSTVYVAWQREADDESPIEAMLAGLNSVFGAYELPVPSVNPFQLTGVDGESAFSMSAYEVAWTEHLRLNQERFGLLPRSSPLEEVAGISEPMIESTEFFPAHDDSPVIVSSIFSEPIAANPPIAASAEVPEMAPSLSVLLGGTFLALRRFARRRKRQ